MLGPQTGGRDLRTRLVVFGVTMLFGLLVLAVNLYRLQVVRYDEFHAMSEDNRFRDVRVRADRGMLLDRQRQILVDGRKSFDIFLTPAFCVRCSAEVLPRLQAVLRWDSGQVQRIEARIKATRGPQRYLPLPVAVDVPPEDFDYLDAHLEELPGVEAIPVQQRNYRSGTGLAHVLGYMNEVTEEELLRLNAASPGERPAYALGAYVGRRGLERAFESKLRGTDGWYREVVNARGQPVEVPGGEGRQLRPRYDEIRPVPGNNLVLSIDARLQAEAERGFDLLEQKDRDQGGQGRAAGVAIVVDVRTGFIRALASRPSYDPNQLTGRVSAKDLAQMSVDPMQPLVFRAVAQHYSPGSTFKVITMLAALKSGVFNTSTTVNCPGGYRLGNRVWRCHKDSGHGSVNARRALQVSCDTYFYRASDLMGIDAIAEEGRALGLGAPTGIGVVAEVPGVMPDTAYHDRATPGGYTKGMALNTAIGQGDVNVTPLQLLMAYAAVANGGKVFQPQLVLRVESPKGETVEEFPPKLLRDLEIPPEQQQMVVDALVAVVNEAGGTGGRARMKDVVVAGKTGTAQVIRLGKVREKKEQMDYFTRDHAWFVAFAPAHDPEIAVLVLNEHGGHGGSDAAPTASLLLHKYFELKRRDELGYDPNPPAALTSAVRTAAKPPPLPVQDSAQDAGPEEHAAEPMPAVDGGTTALNAN